GSKVTLAPPARAGSGAWNSGSMRTDPVKYSAGPLRDGCDPPRLISMVSLHRSRWICKPAFIVNAVYSRHPRRARGRSRSSSPGLSEPPPALAGLFLLVDALGSRTLQELRPSPARNGHLA